IVTVKGVLPSGETFVEKVGPGEMKRVKLGEKDLVKLAVEPAHGFDVGAGPGRRVETEAEGGVVGIIIDGRGRPLSLPEDAQTRSLKLVEWFRALDAYPEEPLRRLTGR
ncbi:MAG: methylaspartate mutase, partial [Bacillota bacterium]